MSNKKEMSTENEITIRPKLSVKNEILKRLHIDASESHRKINEQIAYLIEQKYRDWGK